jgi:hypothetical protein
MQFTTPFETILNNKAHMTLVTFSPYESFYVFGEYDPSSTENCIFFKSLIQFIPSYSQRAYHSEQFF